MGEEDFDQERTAMRVALRTSYLGGPKIKKHVDDDLFELLTDQLSSVFLWPEVPWLYSSYLAGRDFWREAMR